MKSDKDKEGLSVAIFTAICLILLAILFKNFNLETDFISSNVPFFIFMVYMFSRGEKTKREKNRLDRPLYWNFFIITMSMIIFLFKMFL